jgi:hypothetical protein
MKQKHSTSLLFVSMNSPVFNDPCQAAPPVLEDALSIIKSGVIPDPWNQFFNLIA